MQTENQESKIFFCCNNKANAHVVEELQQRYFDNNYGNYPWLKKPFLESCYVVDVFLEFFTISESSSIFGNLLLPGGYLKSSFT